MPTYEYARIHAYMQTYTYNNTHLLYVPPPPPGIFLAYLVSL